MTENPITVECEASILEVRRVMEENKIRLLPVVNRGTLVGIVTERMILQAFPSLATSLSIHRVRYLMDKAKVKDIMVKSPITIPPDANCGDVLLLCQKKRVEGFPVVDMGELVGVTTESDLVRFFRCT